jgi:3-hydroxypropanoate dehydrogenase
MRDAVSPEVLDQLFIKARSHHAWTDRPVPDSTLHSLYELIKWGPTSGNLQPARIVFVRSDEGRKKLMPALAGMGSNPAQVQAAPVTAIFAQDARFYEKGHRLFPRLIV